LPDEVKAVMQTLKTRFPSKNMFHSMIARAIEIYFTLIEAERLLSQYEHTDQSCMNVEPRAGTGYGCTEAPRGILWHRYDMDKHGCVNKAVIVPPTSQNQSRIEEDLKNALISYGLDKTKSDLQLHAEKVIRNYDPCISCATHFINLNLVRDGIVENHHNDMPNFIDIDLSRAAIVGVGSPNEGDEVAWHMIDVLNKHQSIIGLKQKGLSLFKLDRPGINIGESINAYDYVLVIDAIKSSELKQSYIFIDASQFGPVPKQISDHEIGVIESVALLSSLRQLPKQLILIGVEDIRNENIERIVKMFTLTTIT